MHFPIGGRTDMGGRMNPENSRDKKMMHLMFLLQMQDMELRDLKMGSMDFRILNQGKTVYMAAVNWDSTNVMVYEARIPFSVFTVDVQ